MKIVSRNSLKILWAFLRILREHFFDFFSRDYSWAKTSKVISELISWFLHDKRIIPRRISDDEIPWDSFFLLWKKKENLRDSMRNSAGISKKKKWLQNLWRDFWKILKELLKNFLKILCWIRRERYWWHFSKTGCTCQEIYKINSYTIFKGFSRRIYLANYWKKKL